MSKVTALKHEFVEFIPDQLEEGKLYVSIEYATVAHKCCCGCGKEVVTPLSPTDWKLIFDGKFVSLDPSIGNWSFQCKSHYWIRNGRVQWALQWSQEQIERGRAYDRSAKARHFGTSEESAHAAAADVGKQELGKPKKRFWRSLRKWFPRRNR
jgi:hypothetical protein